LSYFYIQKIRSDYLRSVKSPARQLIVKIERYAYNYELDRSMVRCHKGL
jgi:hypothetical protein